MFARENKTAVHQQEHKILLISSAYFSIYVHCEDLNPYPADHP